MRISKVFYEYDSPEEFTQHKKELLIEGLECLSYIHKQNMIGQWVWVGEFVNMKFN